MTLDFLSLALSILALKEGFRKRKKKFRNLFFFTISFPLAYSFPNICVKDLSTKKGWVPFRPLSLSSNRLQRLAWREFPINLMVISCPLVGYAVSALWCPRTIGSNLYQQQKEEWQSEELWHFDDRRKIEKNAEPHQTVFTLMAPPPSPPILSAGAGARKQSTADAVIYGSFFVLLSLARRAIKGEPKKRKKPAFLVEARTKGYHAGIGGNKRAPII